MFCVARRKSFIVKFTPLSLLISAAVVQGILLEVPESHTAHIGDDVTFNCRTSNDNSVDWQFQRQDKTPVNVFIGRTGGGGHMSNGYKTNERYRVKSSLSEGQYTLIIEHVAKEDEGTYICSDIGDPSISASASLMVTGNGPSIAELRAGECQYDCAILEGDDNTLSFQTSKTSSIQLEHRSMTRSYPLHVFRDGRLVNDYYVLSGRFRMQFNITSGTWGLFITNVQLSDAGTYIFSEDNGLGKQQFKEVVVIKREKRRKRSPGECEWNCTVHFSGHCPPNVEWRHLASNKEGNPAPLSSMRVVHVENAVSVILETPTELQHLKPVCLIMTQPYVGSSNDFTILEQGGCPKHLPHQQQRDESNPVWPGMVAMVTVILLISAVITIVVLIWKRKIRIERNGKFADAVRFLLRLIFRRTKTKSDDEKRQSSPCTTPTHEKPTTESIPYTSKGYQDDEGFGSVHNSSPLERSLPEAIKKGKLASAFSFLWRLVFQGSKTTSTDEKRSNSIGTAPSHVHVKDMEGTIPGTPKGYKDDERFDSVHNSTPLKRSPNSTGTTPSHVKNIAETIPATPKGYQDDEGVGSISKSTPLERSLQVAMKKGKFARALSFFWKFVFRRSKTTSADGKRPNCTTPSHVKRIVVTIPDFPSTPKGNLDDTILSSDHKQTSEQWSLQKAMLDKLDSRSDEKAPKAPVKQPPYMKNIHVVVNISSTPKDYNDEERLSSLRKRTPQNQSLLEKKNSGSEKSSSRKSRRSLDYPIAEPLLE